MPFKDKSSAFMYLASKGVDVKPTAKPEYVIRLANSAEQELAINPDLTPKEIRDIGRGKKSRLSTIEKHGHVLAQVKLQSPRNTKDIERLINRLLRERKKKGISDHNVLIVWQGVPDHGSPGDDDFAPGKTRTYSSWSDLNQIAAALKQSGATPLSFANELSQGSRTPPWLSVESIGFVL